MIWCPLRSEAWIGVGGALKGIFPRCLCLHGWCRKERRRGVRSFFFPMTGRWVRVHDEMLSHSAF
jgi:hypothetical protein